MNILLRYLWSCLNCGSFWVLDSMLCRECQAVIDKYHGHRSGSAELKALYTWEPQQSQILTDLVYNLKGTLKRQAWGYFAQKIVSQNLATIPIGKRIIVVPAPGKTRNQRDHANNFALEIADRLGAELLQLFFRPEKGPSQKDKELHERFEVKLGVDEKNSIFEVSQEELFWIFVDDISTTGSTIRAARRALKNPQYFQAWVLAERSRPCGEPKDLL